MMRFGGMWLWVIVLVVLAVVAWRLVEGRPGASRERRKELPLEILKRRCASGEIGREEFEAKRRDLDER